MDLLVALIVGLVAGMLAKAIMPGSSNEPSGWIMTILLGIAGAFIGKLLLGSFFGGGMLMSIVSATIGAIILIAVLRLLTGRRAA